MRRSLFLLMTLLCLAPISITRADDSADLRAENARLRTQLEALQKSCPVAAANPAAAPNPPSAPNGPAHTRVAAGDVAATPAASSRLMSAPLVPSSAASINTQTEASALIAPPGYKLVPVGAPRPEDRYIATGCGNNSPHNVPWKQSANWSLLAKGLSPADVEDLLGPEHYNVVKNGRIAWQYGKCDYGVRGSVVFENGLVVVWQAPTL